MDYANSISSLAGTITSAVSQYSAGQAQKSSYEYNAEITRENMRQEMESSESKYSSTMGQQRSLYGKSGVSISTGSPLLVLVSQSMEAQKEQNRLKNSGELSAKLQRYYGSLTEQTANTNAMSTFLTGLSKTASSLSSTFGNNSLTVKNMAADYTDYPSLD